MQFRVKQPIRICLKTYEYGKGEVIQPSNKVYKVDKKTVEKQNLVNRFARVSDYIEIIEEKEKSELE